MKSCYKEYKRAAKRYLNSNSTEPPESLPTWSTVELIERVEALEAAIKKYVKAYDGDKAVRLGNGQARRSLDEFRELLNEHERGGGSR